jgi:hypothetical protein
MSCRHKPIVKFKHLFARNPEYSCRNCDVRIELKSSFKTILKVINALFLMIVVFRAFKGSGADGTLEGMLVSMGIIVAMAAGYLLFVYLIIRYGPYEEVQEEPEPAEASVENIEAGADTSGQSSELTTDDVQEQNYSEEQKQLMEMYAAYEKLAREKEAAEGKADLKPSEPLPEAPPCNHVPVKSWKNYMPSKMDFECQNCGEKITFSATRKRSMNLIFLAIMVIILMPSFSNFSMEFWKYSLLTLLALVIATIFQIYFVKKWPMELKK